MTNSLPASILLGAANISDKRRGSRLMMEIPVTVMGMNTLGEPFKENTLTTSVSCFGCKLRTKRYAEKNSIVTLEIRRPDLPTESRIVHGRVVWVQRPRHHRETFQIGVELEEPGNVWGIENPPPDWFPCPADIVMREVVQTPLANAERIPVAPPPLAPPQVAPMVDPAAVSLAQPAIATAVPQEAAHAGLAVPWETLTLPEPPPIPPALSGVGSNGSHEAAIEAAKASAEATIAEEVALLRRHFTGSLDTALIETLDIFAKRTAEIVNEAREACRATVREMETEVRKIAQGMQEASLNRDASLRTETPGPAPVAAPSTAPVVTPARAPRRKRAAKAKSRPPVTDAR